MGGFGWRQHPARDLKAVVLGHFVVGDKLGVDRDAAFEQRAFVAVAAAMGEVDRGQTVQQRDAAMAEIKEKAGGALKGAAVVHIEPVIGGNDTAGAAMHDEGNAEVCKERDAVVGQGRARAPRGRRRPFGSTRSRYMRS